MQKISIEQIKELKKMNPNDMQLEVRYLKDKLTD
jgi:hypothetical protein